MDTIVIEILRNGQSKTQYLEKGSNYIALCGTESAKDFMIECCQDDFDNQVKLLRYNQADDLERETAITFFQSLISNIVSQIFPDQLAKNEKSEFLHLRLVTTPKEIAQLPFEMAQTPFQLENVISPTPFFINPKIKTTFTREVRHIFFKHYFWPIIPRILFVFSQPKNKVPSDEHLDAFVQMLSPWSIPIQSSKKPVPELGKLLTIIENASLEKIKSSLKQGMDEKKPYTHVHILAHGAKNPNLKEDPFLLVLNENNNRSNPQYVNGEQLAEAMLIRINETDHYPTIVSLIACDSGNIGSPVHPVGSLAQQLHQKGIPCVFASQFPLTQMGSTKLVTALYSRLLQTSDPRIALYDARIALASENKVHDWASLVAYTRFPDDINEQMKNVKLKLWLRFIETANGLADHINRNINVYNKQEIEANFNEVEKRFNWAIENFLILIDEYKEDVLNKEFYAEHYGLIGSAYKRKAESRFNRYVIDQNIKTACDESIKLLKEAKDWYFKGYRYLNSHWNGTQYLSLSAILNENTINDKNCDIWNLCRIIAQNDEQNAADENSKAWACGTLAELYVLESFFVEKSQKEIEVALTNARIYLVKLKASSNLFAKESTLRQFRRYENWWGKLNANKKMQQLIITIPQLIVFFNKDKI